MRCCLVHVWTYTNLQIVSFLAKHSVFFALPNSSLMYHLDYYYICHIIVIVFTCKYHIDFLRGVFIKVVVIFLPLFQNIFSILSAIFGLFQHDFTVLKYFYENITKNINFHILEILSKNKTELSLTNNNYWKSLWMLFYRLMICNELHNHEIEHPQKDHWQWIFCYKLHM